MDSRLHITAALLLVLSLAAGELPRPVQCPAGISHEVCTFSRDLAYATAAELPLEPALEYLRGLLQSAIEVEHSTVRGALLTALSLRVVIIVIDQ